MEVQLTYDVNDHNNKAQAISESNFNSVKSGEEGDLIEMGIIDPLKVTKQALQNAVSVAVTILSTNAIVTMARTYETN